MNKILFSIAFGTVCISTTTTATAALSADAWLNFDAGVTGGPYGFVQSGSYFGMDTNGDNSITIAERTPIAQNEGLFMGISQAASGSHQGPPGCVYDLDATPVCDNTGESPGLDAPWNFFGNTGSHQTTSATTVLTASGNTATVDFSGWSVTWNGIADIPMGSGAHSGGTESVAEITCAVDCAIGDTYTLDYKATVPQGDPSGFGGVKYTIHLEGTIGDCSLDGQVPTAGNDSYKVATDTAQSLTILSNDADVGCSGLDKANVDLDPATGGQQTTFDTANGSVVVDTFTGVVTYTPDVSFQGLDSFSYTISDRAGNASASTTVDISVGDEPPTCNDDGLTDGAYIDTTKHTSVNIDVLANDQNGSNTILPATIDIISDVGFAEGETETEVDGTITFTPAIGFIGTASFTYNVSDGSQTCADATVNVLVSEAGEPIGGVPNAYLILASGPVGDVSQQPALGEGSWFSMETSPGSFTYVPLVGLNHIQLGTEQPASSDPLMPNIDSAWIFFGNPGVHQTTGVLNQISNDGAGNAALYFTVWDISWNGIASIPMGTGPDNGIATVTCYTDLLAGTPGTCVSGDEYLLTYRATVPAGDPSGFGGVNYVAHFEGVISQSNSQDLIAPVITIYGDNPLSINIGDTYMEPGASAIDDIDSDVAVSISGVVDTTSTGTYTVVYTASDSAGNVVSKTRTVLVLGIDTDGDGHPDSEDNCPATQNSAQLDFDKDGIGDVCDEDDDSDGVLDQFDGLPLDASETTDTDGDGIGDNTDADDDNDGVLDQDDAFPLDSSRSTAGSGGGGVVSLLSLVILSLIMLARRRV